MKKSWLAIVLVIAILLSISTCFAACGKEDDCEDIPLKLRGDYTEEELFGGMTDEEILAKFLGHVGGDYGEKEIIAKIVVDYKNSLNKDTNWSEILGPSKEFYINYRYWLYYVEFNETDLKIAEEVLNASKENKDLTEFTNYYSITSIENSDEDYESLIDGKEFQKTAHFYFVINK